MTDERCPCARFKRFVMSEWVACFIQYPTLGDRMSASKKLASPLLVLSQATRLRFLKALTGVSAAMLSPAEPLRQSRARQVHRAFRPPRPFRNPRRPVPSYSSHG